MSNVVVRNFLAEISSLSAKDFLTQLPRGAYTACRTFQINRVFEYEQHVRRTAESARLMLPESLQHLDRFYPITSYELLEPAIRRTFQIGNQVFRHTARPGCTEDLKITVLLTWNFDSTFENEPFAYDLHAHFSPLPSRPEKPVCVQVKGNPRNNAKAKDSQWVVDRQVLEKSMSPDVNELLLSDGHGNVTEGLSSNFYAVLYKDVDRVSSIQSRASVFTSSEVLDGTVRKLVLEICSEFGIPVIYDKFLNIPNDVDRWDECFITSTSRLVLPIREIDANGARHSKSKYDFCSWLQQQVVTHMTSASPVVFDNDKGSKS
eukprot:ANDGO_05615.mRNA.1 hypothetical protein PPTG_04937